MTSTVMEAAGEDLEQVSGFTVSLEEFSGPFDLLLSLIAKRQLDVTKVALAEVTDEFLAYVRTLDSRRALDESSSFVFVAATLLDMKIVELLPGATPESEEDLAALEARDLLFARLLQYRAFKQIADQLRAGFEQNLGRFPRRPGEHPDLMGLLPELSWNTTVEDIRQLAERAFARKEFEPDDVRLDHLHAHVDALAEREAMAAQLRRTGQSRFSDLIADAETTLIVVVRFLGLLELFRDRAVEFDQPEPLAELTISWVGETASA
ncbi:segregation and condensation protein A [Nesterenkonia alba]|uniref:segregation and condensation protein A n=1 Tax=Nesterenkonia alba TaxID=515814 RepID=UPI0003B5BA0F|nr:ScpA family protein [Nesterenkonia alba]